MAVMVDGLRVVESVLAERDALLVGGSVRSRGDLCWLRRHVSPSTAPSSAPVAETKVRIDVSPSRCLREELRRRDDSSFPGSSEGGFHLKSSPRSASEPMKVAGAGAIASCRSSEVPCHLACRRLLSAGSVSGQLSKYGVRSSSFPSHVSHSQGDGISPGAVDRQISQDKFTDRDYRKAVADRVGSASFPSHVSH